MGVDTHGDLHVACAIDQLGRRLAIADFATTPTGYRAVLEWARKLGEVEAFGVEGCGCYGAGLARFLGAQGQLVLEVNRSDRTSLVGEADSKSDAGSCAVGPSVSP